MIRLFLYLLIYFYYFFYAVLKNILLNTTGAIIMVGRNRKPESRENPRPFAGRRETAYQFKKKSIQIGLSEIYVEKQC